MMSLTTLPVTTHTKQANQSVPMVTPIVTSRVLSTASIPVTSPRRDVLSIDGQTYLQMSPQEIMVLQQSQQSIQKRRNTSPRWLQNLEYAGIVAGVLSLVHQGFDVGWKLFSASQRSTINWGEQATKFGQNFLLYATSAFAMNVLFDWMNSRRNNN